MSEHLHTAASAGTDRISGLLSRANLGMPICRVSFSSSSTVGSLLVRSRKCRNSSNSASPTVWAACESKGEVDLRPDPCGVGNDWEGENPEADEEGALGSFRRRDRTVWPFRSAFRSGDAELKKQWIYRLCQEPAKVDTPGCLWGYRQVRFIFSHLEHFGASSSHYVQT